MQQNQINYDQIVEQIRSQLDLVDIARELGIEIKKTGQNYRSKSFLTDGGNETCVSYKFNGSNLWHDFKTEDTGDVIQLYAHMKCGGDRKLAFRELMERCNISPNNKNFVRDSEFVQDKRYFLNLVNSWHQSLEQEHREYLHSRGITDETIDTLKIGYNAHQNRIMIPYYLEEDKRHNSPVYACGRLFVKECNPSEKYHKWSLKKIIGTDSKTGENIFAPNKYLQNVIWGLDTLDRNKDNILIICEGAFDALSFWQEGYAVISPLTTSFNKSQKEELPKIMSRFHEVMIILDNDDSGQQKAYTLAKLCFDNHIEFSISSVKETESFFTKTGENVVVDGLKDVSDFYSNAITQLDIFSEMNKEETNKEKDKQDIKENKALEETDNKSTKVPISHNLLKPLIDRRKNGLTYLCQKEVDFYPNYGKRYDEIEKILMVACRYYPDRYVRLPVEYFNKQLKYYRFTLKEKDSIKEEINSLEKDKSNEKEEAELARLEVLINSKSDELKEKNKSIKKLKRRILQEEEIRDLEQLVKKGPKDSVLINEILNQHLLLFDSASGFFEFNGLCWNNKPDHYILHIIGEHLGKFNKGRHSTDILKALQGSCYKTVNFNSKEIIAFKNCVLDLQSGFTTKEGNPEDYVTYQLDFDYDPEANCPQWIRFIADVSDSDEGRKQLLKEVGGYTLFSHSKLHKCI